MIVSEDATDHGGCCGLTWEATSAVGSQAAEVVVDLCHSVGTKQDGSQEGQAALPMTGRAAGYPVAPCLT